MLLGLAPRIVADMALILDPSTVCPVTDQPKVPRKLLIMSRSPKPLDTMTDEEIDAWVARIYARIKVQYQKATATPATDPVDGDD